MSWVSKKKPTTTTVSSTCVYEKHPVVNKVAKLQSSKPLYNDDDNADTLDELDHRLDEAFDSLEARNAFKTLKVKMENKKIIITLTSNFLFSFNIKVPEKLYREYKHYFIMIMISRYIILICLYLCLAYILLCIINSFFY
jgi:hypothetical protein